MYRSDIFTRPEAVISDAYNMLKTFKVFESVLTKHILYCLKPGFLTGLTSKYLKVCKVEVYDDWMDEIGSVSQPALQY